MNLKSFITICALVALAIGCAKKTESEAHDEKQRSDVIKLSDESLKVAGIETSAVARGDLNMTLRSAGRISFDLNHTAKVTSTFEGRCAKMNYDLGASVQQGDVMVLVDSPELLNKSLELKAPISGQVVERHGTVGEVVDKAKELYTISDLKNVWCIAEIKEKDIAVVHTGEQASVRVLAYPQEAFTGKLVLIDNEVEENTRTVETRIEVDNANGKLKPGMFADVEIVTSVVQNVLVIPDEALQTLGDQQIVFVTTEPGTFAKRVVKVGHRQGGQVEILDGVTEGERIVAKGSFVLKSELLKSELGEE